ncbi:hypothetical protein M153_15240001010 [Pseudoloma neurophilia]|uniref:CCHC-type domain-containing protein n=1 Tax=Pseudoloma neurophilia TaxID=146866 RepID=A0A0R0LUN1_9MICR|nr:hypothetical protein M153_15240001010 [Pseudoloma neurophilia]
MNDKKREFRTNLEKTKKVNKKNTFIKEKPEMKEITCFRCQQKGHIATNCKQKIEKSDKTGINFALNGSNEVDYDNIEINKLNYMAVFDTDSTENIITEKLFNKISDTTRVK